MHHILARCAIIVFDGSATVCDVVECDGFPYGLPQGPPYDEEADLLELWGSEPVATGSVRQSAEFWRSFVRSSTVMDWIDNGYRLQWDSNPPEPREMPNSVSATEYEEFVDNALSEMVASGAATRLPQGQRPAVVSPIGVVPKPRSEKMRLIINMRYVNRHLIKKVFKFEGLRDLADIIEKDDYMVSFDLASGYYHVGLHPESSPYVAFFWKGSYYQYNCLSFGLSTAPWVFSKVMRELVMYWRRSGIKVLPYLDDFLFAARSRDKAFVLRDRIEQDMFNAGLRINFEKGTRIPTQSIRHLGFDVDTAEGVLRVPQDRWESLHRSVSSLLKARKGRVKARLVAICVGQVISMGPAWGPVTQFYTRELYALLHSAWSLEQWISLSEGAISELMFWEDLPRERFVAPIWPTVRGLSIRIATDASAFGWGGLVLSGPTAATAHEFFNPAERAESSTYRELLGAYRCLQSLVHLCRDRLVVLQVDAMNLLGIINKGSPKLPINELARNLFWFCLRHDIEVAVEWVPREENEEADEISKLLIPDDWMLNPRYFEWLDARWGPHTCDLFASSRNALCRRFFSLHWCPGTAGVNAFAYDWSMENPWINAPFRLIGRVWRTLASLQASATLVAPFWQSATWWRLLAPDASHLSEFVVDWVWLPREDPSLFLPGAGSGNSRPVAPPNWHVLAVRLDFSPQRGPPLSRRDRCLHEGCRSCASRSWHRGGSS